MGKRRKKKVYSTRDSFRKICQGMTPEGNTPDSVDVTPCDINLRAVFLRTKGGAPNESSRVFAENLVGLGFLKSASYIESIPTHEKLFAVGKSGPNATSNLIFLGLGWPWVGEFVGLIIILTCFLISRKW